GDVAGFSETTGTTADGTITYQWQISTTSDSAGFSDIATATTATYDHGTVTADSWFRRIDTSTLNSVACTATTNVLAVTVNNITAGVIAADQTVCSGGDVAGFSETTGTTADGTITYQWQISTTSDSAGFSDIATATTATYDHGTLLRNTWFRRVDTSTLNSVVCTSITNVLTITIDSDKDGIPDNIDLDDDNDGIADTIESDGIDPTGDNDNDGVLNFEDSDIIGYVDNDGDGINDNLDFDGDGIPNYLDRDSDNDGIVDIVEAGGTDGDGDGETDYPISGDPTSMIDNDNDGLDDSLDTIDSGSGAGEVITGTALTIPNSDSDVNPNYLDIDADNDGIVDNIEGQLTVGYIAPSGNDTDNDGIDDSYDPDNGGNSIVPVDTDGNTSENLPDYIDLDSDDDGESDSIEAYDTNNDGIPEIVLANNDADGDGLDDNYDIDDANLDPTNNGQTANNPFPDTDNPGGEPNWRERVIDIIVEKIDTLNDGGDGIVNEGDTITYEFRITNTGSSIITNVTITDPLVVVTGTPIPVLPPGVMDNTSYTAIYTITQADIDNGTFANSATVSGTDINSNTIISLSDDPDDTTNIDEDGDNNPDDDTVTILNQNPIVTLTKVANDATDGLYDTLGEVITYTLEVINSGNVTLSNIIVSDANADIGSILPNMITNLSPGNSVTVTAEHTITQADLDAGIVINRADVAANTPDAILITDMSDDPTTPDPDDATETEVGLAPVGRLGVTKSADRGTFSTVGDRITYTIEIENVGTVTLNNITVIDNNATIVSGLPITTLVVGSITTVIAEHIVTEQDIIDGQVINRAEVIGVTPSGDMISETSDDPNNSTDEDLDMDGDPDDATISILDSDGDGVPNIVDLDDDNDGIPDDVEQNGNPNLDTDGDGIVDRLDLDADGDGVLDVYESGVETESLVISPDGRIEGTVGTDGIPDNVQEVGEEDSGIINYPIQDTDADGTNDFQDVDDDNDGLLTIDENPDPDGNGNPEDAFDSDDNGIPDYLEPNFTSGEDGVTVFSGLSPNGDGVNDVFMIDGIERFENKLEIYNRWGVKVFESKNYGRNDNFFSGISNGRTTISDKDQLPVGTYYYVLEYVLGSGERKSRMGYLYINR
ncbi:gliding motility-associated C-terminal domain-containing protein, partial [Aquimarina sp. AU474]|uniref:gliding motility-associated C-terminal domain-containing protein n=1 Tax=Aquimarina sp. AU474 TaxID=2108529 RepID=UPI00190F14E9